jgi:hypothetical protein
MRRPSRGITVKLSVNEAIHGRKPLPRTHFEEQVTTDLGTLHSKESKELDRCPQGHCRHLELFTN